MPHPSCATATPAGSLHDQQTRPCRTLAADVESADSSVLTTLHTAHDGDIPVRSNTQVKVTNPLGQATTTSYDPLREIPTVLFRYRG
jgi:hypothetical protein